MSDRRRRGRRAGRLNAFSLVELVIVVTIIGLLASIAVPRLTRASSDSRSVALQATLVNVRKAVDVFFAEHGEYPGFDPGSGLPDDEEFVDQLLMYTDYAGKTNAAPSATYKYGPYLRSPFPVNPTNDLATVRVKATPGDANPLDGTVGWVAVLSHGYFGVSASDASLEKIGFKDAADKMAVQVK